MVASEDKYHSKWNSIVNVMKNSNLKISSIAQAGSRARRDYSSNSDMDVIFTVARSPNKREFYPKLMKLLKNNFPEDRVFPGSHYNVIHINFKKGGIFDLVLLTEGAFDKQHGTDVEFRREHL